MQILMQILRAEIEYFAPRDQLSGKRRACLIYMSRLYQQLPPSTFFPARHPTADGKSWPLLFLRHSISISRS